MFTSPTFTTDKTAKEKREFYIPKLNRERNLYGTDFEIRLHNQLSQKARLVKAIKYLALAIATAVAMELGLTSCNVTRTITTESKSLTHGDTAIIIQSKTIESYNARKN